ncbi:universal stress protein [Kovacikia minuta CCNUW1]|uniref:universal stress protein n=1 Tax=Kovacikia minuta TaxID=2931930 RepID=UPI001CCF21EC|nr:universal stress protein [Kovacikia minuta]UBF27026.1 universal stress protein [Kovacikia minuta CCNUW1]
MNILSVLARLEDALGCVGLAKQMILLPQKTSVNFSPRKEINLVVGYNGSPQSQTALDLTLWIAHQTRLATRTQVTVQVVYVVNLETECGRSPYEHQIAPANFSSRKSVARRQVEAYGNAAQHPRTNSAIAELPVLNEQPEQPQSCQVEQFDQADRILWQARHLADEWRGSLKTHLRFGQVAKEIRDVVIAESASLLLLGCNSSDNPVVQQLGTEFPCPILGIPPATQ